MQAHARLIGMFLFVVVAAAATGRWGAGGGWWVRVSVRARASVRLNFGITSWNVGTCSVSKSSTEVHPTRQKISQHNLKGRASNVISCIHFIE